MNFPPRRVARRTVLAFALAVLTGCATTRDTRPPPLVPGTTSRAEESTAEALYQEGIDAVGAADYDTALARFTEIVEDFPASGVSGLALYWQGRTLYQMRQDDRAATALERYLDLAPALPFKENAALLLANSRYGQDRYEEALESALRSGPVSSDGLADYVELARDLVSRLERPVVVRAADLTPERAWLAPFYLQAARWALADGDDARARALAARVLDFDGLPPEILADARSLAGGDPGRAGLGRGLGFIAPTEGRFASVSEQVRRGIQIAIDDIDRGGSGSIELVERTSSDDPDSTVAVIREMARGERVVGILGPLVSAVALSAGEAAGAENVPLVSPTATDARMLEIGPRVFSVNVLDGKLGFTLGNYAVRTLERSPIAILALDNPYGRIQADAFTRAVESSGGEISLRLDYDSGKGDFTDELGEIVRSGARAVFMATNRPQEALRIQNQIAFYELGLLPLGTDAWNDAEFASQGGGFVRGYFADTFSRDPRISRWQDFAASYEARYGEPPPNRIPAWGYDAARILVEHLGTSEAASRRAGSYRGASGLFRFLPEGPRRAVVIHRIQGGEPVAVEW